MNRPAFHLSLPAFVISAALLAGPAVAAQESKTNYAVVAHSVVKLLEEAHYSLGEFGDELSRKSLQHFIDTLDYSRMYFTKGEIDDYNARYATTLDDAVNLYKLEPAKEMYGAFAKKVQARYDKIKALIEGGEPLDFKSAETVEITRKESPWAVDEAALDVLWRKEITREILQERLNLRRAEERRKEKEAKEKSAPPVEGAGKPPVPGAEDAGKGTTPAGGVEPAKAVPAVEKKTPDTPEQKVLKRHKRFLDAIVENDEEDITNFFLSAITAAYDPHSEYMSAPEKGQFDIEMKKALYGIGAVLQSKDGAAEIRSVVVGGPADKSGQVKMGDMIIAVAQGVDGEMEDIEGMKLQKIVEKVRGDEGTVVRLRIQPKDDPMVTREVLIQRAKVEMKDTLAKGELIEVTPEGKAGAAPVRIGWINLDSFYADMENRDGRSATKDVKIILNRLEKENVAGLVLDLRGNGGGSLDEAIKLTGLFIKPGPVVQQRDSRDRREPRIWKGQPVYDGPLTVLTDRASASASEIFAAALQDCGRAVIVGDQSTFGKGTVQTLLDVGQHMPVFSQRDRAGSLKVTIAKFYRISGGSTQNEGVEPDIVLPSRYDAMDVGERFLKDPLPYDKIEKLPYEMSAANPLPIVPLKEKSAARVASDKDYGYVREYIQRTRDLIKKNVVSLNEETRLAEDKANEARNKAQSEERKQRVAEAAKVGDPFKVYPLTLENAGDAQLKLDSEVKKEAKPVLPKLDDEEEAEDTEDEFPHGFDPGKLETLRIIQDLVEHSAAKSGPKDTAKTK
jgi:carboxyl-terminal processing protease